MGATLAVVALITGQVLLLPLIGIIFVLEAGSDILQIASFKLTGKRIFRMAPLHHHFELVGLGRREDHDALLDRRRAGRAPGRDVLPVHDVAGAVTRWHRRRRPIDLDTLSLDSFRDQPVAVLGLARSGVA